MADHNVVMFLSNAYRPDLRVEKEAVTINNAGYPVTVVAWDRLGELPAAEIQAGIRIQRVQNVKTKYGSGIRQVFYLPRFWREAIRVGLADQPDIVHCHDLDTLYIGVQLKRRLKCKLIFDAHEDYPALMSLYLPAFAPRLLRAWERFLMQYVDQVITASTVLADKYRAAGFPNITNIPNVQDLTLFDQVTAEQVERARQKIEIDPKNLVVTYIGGFSRNRLLLPLIEAVSPMEDTTLLLFGDGHQKEEVEKATRETKNCHYLGWLPLEEIPVYMKLSDVIYYCLKPDYPGAVFNAPNTLAHAMASGRPIIANNLGDLGRVVNQAHCGILLDQVDPGTIKAAIEQLRNSELRGTLGNNGRQYAMKEYNWATISKQLVELYQRLVL